MKLILGVVLSMVLVFGLAQYAHSQSEPIPNWIKGVVVFWAEDKITDEEFIEALEFLISTNVIKIDSQDIPNFQTRQSQLETCIELELSGFELLEDMLDHTNSQDLPVNSYDTEYPDSLLDDMATSSQKELLSECHDPELRVAIYLDSDIREQGIELQNYVIDSLNQHGYDDGYTDDYFYQNGYSDECWGDLRCIESINALEQFGVNSVMDDMLLLVTFLELDLLLF